MNEVSATTILGILTLIINYTNFQMIFPRRFNKVLSIILPVLFTAIFYMILFHNGLMTVIFGGARGFVHLPMIYLLTKGRFFQRLFCIIMQMLNVGVLLAFSKLIAMLLMEQGSAGYWNLYIGTACIAYAAYVVLTAKFGRWFVSKLFFNDYAASWVVYSVGALFLFAIFSMTFEAVNDIPTYILMVFSTFFSMITLCFAIINTHEKTKQRYEAERREQKFSDEKTLLENLNRTKAEFFGNISHEMKTPLTIIATDIQLSGQLMDEGKTDNAKELMMEAWQETMQTANLVTDALAFSRGQEVARQMELFSFGAVIEATLAVFDPFVKKQGNTLKRDIDKTAQISGNADMLASALVNLLSNANRHTSGGVIKVGWTVDAGQFRLTVSDNGSGISPEMLPRVFERGVTDGSGTGLGLAIVKNITELHKGEVAIESEAGKGTSVTLLFPMPEASVPLAEEDI